MCITNIAKLIIIYYLTPLISKHVFENLAGWLIYITAALQKLSSICNVYINDNGQAGQLLKKLRRSYNSWSAL